MEEYSKAHADYCTALRLDDKSAVFYANRGVCLRKVGYLQHMACMPLNTARRWIGWRRRCRTTLAPSS